jgi:hypothetical protein
VPRKSRTPQDATASHKNLPSESPREESASNHGWRDASERSHPEALLIPPHSTSKSERQSQAGRRVRDGNSSSVARGTEANIGGHSEIEISCFYRNNFGEWNDVTYES